MWRDMIRFETDRGHWTFPLCIQAWRNVLYQGEPWVISVRFLCWSLRVYDGRYRYRED